MFIELMGWAGSICFTVCGIPLAWQVYKTKHTDDLNWLFLMLWLWGEIFSFIYVMTNESLQIPLITNYIIATVNVGYIIYVKIKYSHAKEEEHEKKEKH
jgi:uncharacterized protein with PQ loop repeat